MEKYDVVLSEDCFAACANVAERGVMNWRNSIVPLISSTQHPCPVENCDKDVQLRHLARHINTHTSVKSYICYRCPVRECKYTLGSEHFFTKLSHCITHYFRLHCSNTAQRHLVQSPGDPTTKYTCATCGFKFSTRDAIRIHCSRKSHSPANISFCSRRQKQNSFSSNLAKINATSKSDQNVSDGVQRKLPAIAPKISFEQGNITESAVTPLAPSQVCFLMLDTAAIRSNASKTAELGCQTENASSELEHAITIATSPVPNPPTQLASPSFSPLFVEAETYTVPATMHSTAAQTVSGHVQGEREITKSPVVDLTAMSVQTDALDFYRWMSQVGTDDNAFTSHAETQTMTLEDSESLFMSSGAGDLAFQHAGTQTSAKVLPHSSQNQHTDDVNQDLLFFFGNDNLGSDF